MKQYIIGSLSLVLIFVLYLGISYRQHQINPKDTSIPNVKQLYEGIIKVTTKNEFGKILIIEDGFASLKRLFLGLFFGIISAWAIGILMGYYSLIEYSLIWPIKFLGSIPPTAMLAIYFVIFGIDIKMHIAMIAIGIFPSLTLSIYYAVKNDVSEHLIDKAYTLGADQLEIIFNIIINQILPKIIEFIRISIGPALIFLIAAEWNNASVGFGFRLKIESRLTEMNVVYIYLIILACLSFLIDFCLVRMRNYFCKYINKEVLINVKS